MTEAAEQAGLSPNHNVSLVERCTDGADLGDGLVEGLRFDIVGGKPSYRVGVRPDEHGAITVEITSAAARDLNRLRGDAVVAALERYLAFGKLRQDGDPSHLGPWIAATKEPIVDRTG
ncbi:hypothetical protein [Herbaspirillum camelliae]|uniref:hypothetical protein n=1 Tax=Herbaspirillum camelliae TaxID=1892903 RepID=UPI000A73EE9D|nr:hypothetical protein [Herbaspirillum camelliae]